MEALNSLALALGAAWASGISLYATVLVLGGLDLMGVVDLPGPLQTLSSPMVLFIAGALYFFEFFADKVPGVDTVNDFIHTFIRVPAGAVMASGAVSEMDVGISPDLLMALALIAGGAVTLSSHAAKAGGRAIVNTSPEPFSNIIVSFAEDVMVVAGLLLAIFQPVFFFASFAVFALFMIWLLPKIWRGVRGFFHRYRDPGANVPWRREAWRVDPDGLAVASPRPLAPPDGADGGDAAFNDEASPPGRP